VIFHIITFASYYTAHAWFLFYISFSFYCELNVSDHIIHLCISSVFLLSIALFSRQLLHIFLHTGFSAFIFQCWYTTIYILYNIFGNSGDSGRIVDFLPSKIYTSVLRHNFHNRTKILLDYWQNFLFIYIYYKRIRRLIILSIILPKYEWDDLLNVQRRN